MLKYAKIENEETKQCSVGLGTNIDFYKSIGMVEMDVEQAYNGYWYLEGYAPKKPNEEILAEKRVIRNQYLQDSDKYVLIDFPITAAKLKLAKEYRQYLRDFFEDELAALTLPVKTFEEYIGEN